MEYTGTILIVDESSPGRQALQALLAPEPYHLISVGTGDEAITTALSSAVDLILLDVMMPEMDGFEVCRRMRAHPALADIPIVLVMALDDHDARQKGFEAGADDFVSKPFDTTELRMRVRTIMRINRYQRLVTERKQFTEQLQKAHQAAEERAERFRLLIEMGRDLMGAQSLDELLQLALARSTAFIDYDSGSVLLLESAEGPLEVRSSFGYSAVPPGTRVESLERSVSGWVLREKKPLVLDGHGESFGIEWRTYTKPVPSTVTLPLIDAEGHAIGVLALSSTNKHRSLSNDDLDALQLLASQLTVMIERSRLHDENMQLLQKLAERERRLKDLVEKLMASQEEERRRVAYELHDGLAQVAVSAHLHLQTFSSLYQPRNPRIKQELEQALDLAKQVVHEARLSIAGLRPTVLDDFGLASALRLEVEKLREEGWTITYEESLPSDRLSSAVETAFFRIAQEALTNIRKHAHTTRARVVLHQVENMLHLEVQDWGSGFDVSGITEGDDYGEHIGLLGMEERITLLGGGFRISSQPGVGTLVVAEAPMSLLSEETVAYESDSPALPDRLPDTAHLIIADDHELSRSGIRNMLTGERDIEVIGEAKNGYEALELCRVLRPNLALIDVRMPGMDGLETTRAIKQVCPETSVIIVTMHENPDYLIAAMKAGASGYLLKDTSRRELLSAIRHVMHGESFLNTELTQRLLQHLYAEKPSSNEVIPEPLTSRERDVLQLLTQGQTNREIARELVISAGTVKVHVQHIIAKLGVSDRTQAAVRAVEMGLLESARSDVSIPNSSIAS